MRAADFQLTLSRESIAELSALKSEPAWMTEFRLKAYASLNQADSDVVLPILEPEKKHVPDPDLVRQGVIFMDMAGALREHPDLFKKHFASIVRPEDGRYESLNAALWSGGSFLYVPRGVTIDRALQAQPQATRPGPYERTIIVAEEGSSLHCVEGCMSPASSEIRMRSTVVEIRAMKGARVRCTTLSNWAGDVLSIATKRAVAHEGALVEWVDASFGSKQTVCNPAVTLAGKGACAEILTAAFTGRTCTILSNSKSQSLSLDGIDAERLFYLMTRGLDRAAATALIVNGFFEPFTKELPLEYAVEFSRLIELELEGV